MQSNHSDAEVSNRKCLTVGSVAFNLRALWVRFPEFEKMIDHSHSYRYYYYYGPLSGWRDGRAMGCREMIT